MVSRQFVPSALGDVRLATPEDASSVIDLLTESMKKNFRVEHIPDIIELIETSILSVIQLDCNGAIIGFLAAKDYPLIPSVHPGAWEEYVATKYKTVEMNARNTLFIHLLCWDRVFSREVVDSLMKSIFMHDSYLCHIAMVKSLTNYPLLVPGQSRCEMSFRRVTALERGVPGDMLPVLCVADRSAVCPRLRIRRAVEEDNDDLIPIIERHSERLRELYGEFYISELISRHPESERVLLVCEHKELAVGVMILNTQINFEALEASFELSPYAGLRHLSAKPAGLSEKDVDLISCNFADIPTVQSTFNLGSPSEINFESSPSKKKGVSWINVHDGSMLSRIAAGSAAGQQQTSFHHRDVLEILEDDDELEFDIVNIDTDLLRVPKMISYDSDVSGVPAYISQILDGTREDSIDFDKMYERGKYKRSSATNFVTPYVPPEAIHYVGESNAFLLEVFAMDADYDERYGFDILEVAYELFPNREYCILCLPSNHVAFPLLEHFTLVTPFGCRREFINESLYVAHVNSVRGRVSIRPGEAHDISDMNEVLEHAPRKLALLDLFQKSLVSYNLDSFVFLSQNQPIGMVIVGPLDGGTAIRTQYDLDPEPRRPGTDGAIVAGVISPLVEPHTRWYIRDVLRQSKYTSLFWLCRPMARGEANPARNLMSLAGHMIPVRPRRVMPNISGHKNMTQIFKDLSSPFALWALERPFTSWPKVDVNSSIVVVGASRTGLAFLETLIMGPASRYLTFTNLTLITEHGLPTVSECLRSADTCVPKDGRYTDWYLKSVPFYFYVDVLAGVMTGIDRKKKCIYLKSGGVKYYDELVLTCGLQFQHPDYLAESLALVKELEKGKLCDRILMDNPKYQPDRVPTPPTLPENVMIVNSLFQANIYMRKLLRMISDAISDEHRRLSSRNQVIVYGDCIEAYSCMAALLQLGISADKIAFVEPFPPEDPTALRVNCFNNEVVDERVQASLARLGIRVYRRCRFTSWQTMDAYVVGLNLMSRLHAFQIPCFALFYYGLKAIDLNSFKAINECGLVYDGGLVVGPMFDTNDPHIYAAGTCVRYSRRLYANHRLHKYYCSEDIGEVLASLFLRKFNPFVMGDPTLDSCPLDILPRYNSGLLLFSHASIPNLSRPALGKARRWEPVKTFDSPISQSATLPGPLYYMKVRKPGPEIPMEVQLSLPHQGHTLITNKMGNYFRLQLNVLHCVADVTCLSKKKFHTEVINQLYGKHEAFFNKLLARYMINKIDDLFEFFVQPWMSALYQETFNDLLSDINSQDVGTVFDMLKSHFALFDVEEEESLKSAEIKISAENPKSSLDVVNSNCSNTPICEIASRSFQHLGTFRSVIDKFITNTSYTQLVNVAENADIPSECGQSFETRNEVRGFWNAVGGERLVNAHIARYLDQNSVCNPHYAQPKPELI